MKIIREVFEAPGYLIIGIIIVIITFIYFIIFGIDRLELMIEDMEKICNEPDEDGMLYLIVELLIDFIINVYYLSVWILIINLII